MYLCAISTSFLLWPQEICHPVSKVLLPFPLGNPRVRSPEKHLHPVVAAGPSVVLELVWQQLRLLRTSSTAGPSLPWPWSEGRPWRGSPGFDSTNKCCEITGSPDVRQRRPFIENTEDELPNGPGSQAPVPPILPPFPVLQQSLARSRFLCSKPFFYSN